MSALISCWRQAKSSFVSTAEPLLKTNGFGNSELLKPGMVEAGDAHVVAPVPVGLVGGADAVDEETVVGEETVVDEDGGGGATVGLPGKHCE